MFYYFLFYYCYIIRRICKSLICNILGDLNWFLFVVLVVAEFLSRNFKYSEALVPVP